MTAHACAVWRSVDANDPAGPYVCEECGAPMPERPATTPCPKCGALLPVDEVLAHGECGYTTKGDRMKKTSLSKSELDSETEAEELTTLAGAKPGDRIVLIHRLSDRPDGHRWPVFEFDGASWRSLESTSEPIPASLKVFRVKRLKPEPAP